MYGAWGGTAFEFRLVHAFLDESVVQGPKEEWPGQSRWSAR